MPSSARVFSQAGLRSGFVLTAISWSLPLAAQVCRPGELRVLVKDSQEAAIYNAQVRLGPDSAAIAVSTTETTGIVDFENVPCGVWAVRAVKEGFQPASVTAEVSSGAAVEVTLKLEPQISRTSVDVSDTAAPLVEQGASASNELHPAEVRNLPGNPATVIDTLP